MILTCPSCATRWTVNSTDLANPGRMVRCSSCGHTWLPDAGDDTPSLPPMFSAAPEMAPAAPKARAGQPDDASIVRPPPAGSSIDDDFDAFLNAPITPKAEPDLPPMDFLAAMADAAADAKTAPASTESIIAKSLFAMDDDEDEPAPKPAKGRGRNLPPSDEMVSADALRDKLKTADAEDFSDMTPPPLDPPIHKKPGKPARAAAPAAKRSAGSPIGWALLVLIFCGTAAGLYFGRTKIVEVWPPAAIAYARAGLPVGFAGEGFDLADVASTRRDDVGLLIIEGRVLNTTGNAKPAPKLKAIVSGPDDKVLKEWVFAGPALPPNAAEPFKVELKDLPQAADKLVVTFSE